MRILVVEDDKGTARFIKKGLSEEGFITDVVSGGEEGLFMATTEIYDFDTQSNIIEVHVNRLRAKVDKGFSTKLIHRVRGVGYDTSYVLNIT
jgi:DNA-binding response OmpR family regulator